MKDLFYYVSVSEGKIIAKSQLTERMELSEHEKEVSKEIYESIGRIPCSYKEKNGEITSVEHIERPPESPPEPTEIDLLKQENELLKAQNQALADKTDFHEGVLTEIILEMYS